MWSCVGRGGFRDYTSQEPRGLPFPLYLWPAFSRSHGICSLFLPTGPGTLEWVGFSIISWEKRLLPLSRFQRLSVLFFPVFDPISKCLHLS